MRIVRMAYDVLSSTRDGGNECDALKGSSIAQSLFSRFACMVKFCLVLVPTSVIWVRSFFAKTFLKAPGFQSPFRRS